MTQRSILLSVDYFVHLLIKVRQLSRMTTKFFLNPLLELKVRKLKERNQFACFDKRFEVYDTIIQGRSYHPWNLSVGNCDWIPNKRIRLLGI